MWFPKFKKKKHIQANHIALCSKSQDIDFFITKKINKESEKNPNAANNRFQRMTQVTVDFVL